MRDFAEKSVEQARKAMDGFLGAAQKTVDTFEGSATTVQASAKDMTAPQPSRMRSRTSPPRSISPSGWCAKDMQEAMQIQAEFVRTAVRVDADADEGVRPLSQTAMSQSPIYQTSTSKSKK